SSGNETAQIGDPCSPAAIATPKSRPVNLGNPQSPIKNRKSKIANQNSYAITKHTSWWHLTFNGQKAVFDHEQGAFYVAYLLLNPPSEPIHGMALELKANAYFRQSPQEPCATFL